MDKLFWLSCRLEAVASPISRCKACGFLRFSPEGVIACVTKNGQYLGIYEPGMHWCLPWTEAQYLITKQNIVFDQPVTSCPTSDNIFIEVRISKLISADSRLRCPQR